MLISRLGFVLCYNFIMKSIQVFDKLKDIFNKAGYRLFIIGGTSRDLLLGREINDFDFVTDATPEQEKEFLLGANFAFAQYGAISIKIDDNKCDIVTLRKENSYSDGRHPDNIEFLDRVFGYLATVERGNIFTVYESVSVQKNNRLQTRILQKKIASDNDVFNIAFLEYLYKYFVDKNNKPIKMRFKLPKGTEPVYYNN